MNFGVILKWREENKNRGPKNVRPQKSARKNSPKFNAMAPEALKFGRRIRWTPKR